MDQGDISFIRRRDFKCIGGRSSGLTRIIVDRCVTRTVAEASIIVECWAVLCVCDFLIEVTNLVSSDGTKHFVIDEPLEETGTKIRLDPCLLVEKVRIKPEQFLASDSSVIYLRFKNYKRHWFL